MLHPPAARPKRSPYKADQEIRNRLLIALPSQVREQVLDQCQHVEFPPGQTIYTVGAPVEQVYFVNSGLVSVIKTMDDGRSAEIGAMGIEGLIGVFAANGLNRPLVDYTVQLPVTALRMDRMALRNEMSKYAALSRLIQTALFLHVEQIAQTAACNRLHSLEQRCSRWLLVAHDNTFSDRFLFTHESLAALLGVQRPSLSVIANALQKRGLIRYMHGRITIMDRGSMEDESCECYRIIRREFDALLGSRKPAKTRVSAGCGSRRFSVSEGSAAVK